VARFDRTIPPGGEGKITMQLRTKGYQGNIRKSARVFTNDPKSAQITITMHGEVWAPIQVKPRYVHLKGVLGEAIEQVVDLRGEKKEPLIVKLGSVSIPNKVSVELSETEKERTYQLKVKNKVEKEGAYRGNINLTTNYPETPKIVIQIAGNIRATVDVRPKVLNYGRFSEERLEQLKSNDRFMKRPVMVLLNKGDDLKINKVEVEKSLFKVVTKETQPGRMVQLLVEPILEKLKKGINLDRLKIYTNQKDHEILEVPIRFEILQQASSKKPQ
jgi:hypothetical protein